MRWPARALHALLLATQALRVGRDALTGALAEVLALLATPPDGCCRDLVRREEARAAAAAAAAAGGGAASPPLPPLSEDAALAAGLRAAALMAIVPDLDTSTCALALAAAASSASPLEAIAKPLDACAVGIGLCGGMHAATLGPAAGRPAALRPPAPPSVLACGLLTSTPRCPCSGVPRGQGVLSMRRRRRASW